MLVRLMYASRAVPAVDQRSSSRSCARARPTTPTIGVTGVLCFSGGIFLQVLEGGRSAVNQLYNRIAADPRHTEVEVLLLRGDRRAALRQLVHGPGQHVAPEPLAAAEVLRPPPTLDPYSVSGSVSLALFEELVATASVIGPQ
jgi:hypothetical protein